MTPESIQTTISIVTGIINLVLLTFLIHFFRTFREIAKEREDLIKEQKNLSDTKVEVVEKELAFTDRQNIQLNNEKEMLQKQLTEILKSEGVDKSFLLDNSLLKNLTGDFIEKVDILTSKLEKIELSVNQNGHTVSIDGTYHLSIGNGYIISEDWVKATYHLDLASQAFPNDSNIHFTRGVCYANIRGGIETDCKSIEAYSRAIIYLKDSEKETRNRSYIYRGAMFKRIGKLDEAECDIKFGLANTLNRDFQADGLYNLACIYAMYGDKENLLGTIKLIKQADKSYLLAIKYHLSDYFVNFKNDADFIKIID
jgi:tetratricopeptide (TPR) repeat protein